MTLTNQGCETIICFNEAEPTAEVFTYWKNVNSSRFDSKRFKAECPDLYAAYSKQTTTCRFVLA